MLQILLIENLNVFSLELADEDHVIVLAQGGFGTELSRNILHHVIVLAVDGGDHRVEILPRDFRGTKLHYLDILCVAELVVF